MPAIRPRKFTNINQYPEVRVIEIEEGRISVRHLIEISFDQEPTLIVS